MRYLFTFAVLLIAFPVPTLAAIDEEGAAHLKTIFQDLIEEKAAKFEQNGAKTLRYEGEVNVEISDTHYAVTLPHATVSQDENTRTEIGMIAINVVPHDNPKLWKMAVALPTPIITYNQNNEILSRLDLGKQRAAGIWHEELKHFIKLDARYEDIDFQKPKEYLDIVIPKASILYNLAENEAGTWSGPTEVTLENTAIKTGPQQDATFEKIRIGLEIFEYDPKALHAQKETADTIFDLLKVFGDGFNLEYEMTGASLSQPEIVGPGDVKLVFSKAHIGLEAKGMSQDNVSLALRLGFEDLSLPEKKHAAAPENANINISIHNIPFSQIAELGQNTMQGALNSPETRKLAGLGLALKLPALLSVAGTEAKIKDTYFGHDSYNITLEGQAKADLTAANSATANTHIEVTGMDWLVENVEKAAANEKDQQPGAMIRTLIRLKDVAKIETNVDGAPVHVFDFVMNEKGQMLLNDQNALMLLMPQLPGLAAQKAPAAEETVEENSNAESPPESDESESFPEQPSPAAPPGADAPDQ